MGRLTLRLPDTLHKELTAVAKQEGVSLNQYIVYALTRQITLAHTIQLVPEEELARQFASVEALLQSLGQASFDEIEAVLADRDPVGPEPGLDRERVERLQRHVAQLRASE
jgi:hypothetical protein